MPAEEQGVTFDLESLTPKLSPHPSEATMQLWCQVADTYDASELGTLWRYQFQALSSYTQQVGNPAQVVRAVMFAQAYGMILMGTFPDPTWSSLCYAYGKVPKDSNWLLLQDYVQDISKAWADIGQ